MENNNGKKRTNGIISPIHRFFKIEAAGGIVLMIFTLIALIWANSSYGYYYQDLWENKLTIGIGSFKISKSILHWVNDGLMAIFFFVVGLEIKRELLAGELSSPKKAALPIAAAIGGMVVPAGMYIVLNTNPATEGGWGIPMATDIAFSLGILSLLGKRVPLALKIFLVAFAIVDDLGAVLIIALFYSETIYWNYLFVAFGLLLILVIFNRVDIRKTAPYLMVGIVIWYLFLKSGIHPTIAGVLIAFTIPVKRMIRRTDFRENMQKSMDHFFASPKPQSMIALRDQHMAALHHMKEKIEQVQSPAQKIEHGLHGFVTFFVMPLFALINAGVVLKGARFSDIFSNVSGIIEFSLVGGKIIGIFLFSYIAVKLGLASLPERVKWKHIISLGFLGGMGFTMSLFVSNLAFKSEALLNPAKIGILTGSLIAGIGGYIMLYLTLEKNNSKQ